MIEGISLLAFSAPNLRSMQNGMSPLSTGAPFPARSGREKWGISPDRGNQNCTRLYLVPIAAVLLLTGCSPRDFLTRRLATDLISASTDFRSPQRFVLQTGLLSSKDYPSPEYLVLQHRGWITANPAPCTPGLVPPPCSEIVLTPSGVDAVRAALPPEEASGSLLPIPAARRELVAITGIARQAHSAEVEFSWKWVPLNEIGAALYSGDVRYKSLVAFRKYDDGWRLLEGAPRSGQSLDDALKNADPIP